MMPPEILELRGNKTLLTLATPDWPLQWFTKQELACRHCGALFVCEQAALALDRVRARLDLPLRLTSAYRCATHNKNVKGAPRSRHMICDAFDIKCNTPSERLMLIHAAFSEGFHGIGIYDDFIHIDYRMAPALWYS